MAFIPYEGDVIPIEEDMLMPVSGTMGGGYGDSRSGGLRKHKGGDLFAPAGTPLVAPGNMEFIQGRKGGTNLRNDDWWSHWRDLDTGREYRFAHHGPISDYTPGQVVPKGEQWGEIGNVVDSPHLHMAVYDPTQGKNIDWMAPLGLKRGTPLSAGLSFAEAAGKQLEQRASKVAAKTPTNQMVPYEGEVVPLEQPPTTGMTPYTGEVVPEARQQPAATPTAFPTPGGLLDNFFRPFPADRKQQMIQSILTPPENVGYRPEIVRPMVNALGLGGGGLLGTAGGGPLGGLAGAGLGFGLSQKAADFLDTYLGGKPAPTLTESLGQTAREVPIGMMMQGYGEVAGPALQSTIKGLGAVAKPIIGRLGGTGVKNVEEALTGGQAFTDALRGKVSGEDVVQTFKDATQSIKDARAARYQQQLAELSPPPGTTGWDIDTSPIQNHLRDQMNLFRIKVTPEGAIDTSVSALNESGRKDATKIIDEVWNWPDKSPLGLDALKRRLDDFYSESSKARAFVTSMRNKVKDVLTENVPGYAEMTKDYAEATTFIKDIEAGLMQRKQGLTGRVTADMALRRITSAMRDNFNMRGELVDALGAKTGEDLSGMVAGYNMRSMVPHGLAGSGATLLGSGYLSFFNPKILPLLVAASPRVQGEFLRMFGKGLAETKGISLPIAKVQTYLALMPKTQKILEEENK